MFGTFHPMFGMTLHRFARLICPPDIRIKHEPFIDALDDRQSKTTPLELARCCARLGEGGMFSSGVFPRIPSMKPGFT